MTLDMAMTLLDKTPKAWFMREVIENWDLIKINIFGSVKDIVKRMNR
jgi:hypothetical protein